jgi:hypothetical protein
MIRPPIVARLWYVLGAIGFALMAAGLTARRNGFGPLFVFTVAFPTMLVACIAALDLITEEGVATFRAWLLAGVFVPVAAVIGFLGTGSLINLILTGHWGPHPLFLLEVLVGSMITVPVGLAGHVLLRWLIKARFRPSQTTSR